MPMHYTLFVPIPFEKHYKMSTVEILAELRGQGIVV